MTTNEDAKTGRWVYARYIRRKDGRIVYPKNGKFFRFWVEK